jgi:Kef-type K+ transport system membrane component KefB
VQRASMLSAVTLLGLAGILAISLIGPLLAVPRRYGAPIVVGELAVGVLLGTTGLRVIHPSDPILTFLAQAGFGLVMLVAGSHVPIADHALRKAALRGLSLAVGAGVIAVPIAAALSSMAHTHHTALYAVLLSSSSAAVIMPIVQGEGLTGDHVLTLMAQVAIADTACIIALPLAADPSKAGRAAVGAVIVLAVAGLAYLVLRELADRNLITKLQGVSVRHNFGLEMRVSLAALFGLAGLAVNVHVSVMLAGFAFGLVLSAIGTPRRLASQIFAVSEGFLGPIFFIWLGASIDLRALVDHPRLVVLAVGLAAATTAIHALARLLGQPLPLAVLASAQLGVPVAAVALGAHSNLLQPGEGGAILGAAVLTLAVAAVVGGYARRSTDAAGSAATEAAPAPVSATGHDDVDEPAPTAVIRAKRPAAATTPTPATSTSPTAPTTSESPTTPSVATPSVAPARSTPALETTRPVARKRTATRPKPATAVKSADPTNVKTSRPARRETDATEEPQARPRTADSEPAARAIAPSARPPTFNAPTPNQPTPNPASRPIVQSNVRVQPAPQRQDRTPPTRSPQPSRPARSDDDS